MRIKLAGVVVIALAIMAVALTVDSFAYRGQAGDLERTTHLGVGRTGLSMSSTTIRTSCGARDSAGRQTGGAGGACPRRQ
jgi:hypothetical protein